MTTNETPFGPLSSLVGRTFERDGMKRKMCSFGEEFVLTTLVPGGDERWWTIEEFIDLLNEATEVKQRECA